MSGKYKHHNNKLFVIIAIYYANLWFFLWFWHKILPTLVKLVQSDLLNTKGSILLVFDKPYHTNKKNIQKGERIEILWNYAFSKVCLSISVEEPCQLGCSGLGFCTNLNNRPTEHFRSCNRVADEAARKDIELWEKGEISLPNLSVPVKGKSPCQTCLSLWKVNLPAKPVCPCER